MKAELVIPKGYVRVKATAGLSLVMKDDYVFDPFEMKWVKLEVACKIKDCFFVIRKDKQEAI